MIEIKFRGNYELAELAGHSITEARGLYKTELGIVDKAVAVLNGKNITAAAEAATILKNNDSLEFKMARGHRAMYLVGALLLAMGITGGVFAFGFTSSSATISTIMANSDFASVTANTSSLPTWTARGLQKNTTGCGTLFDINTQTSGYTGDFVATVSLANLGDLVKVYHNLTLTIEVRDSCNNLVDINGDGTANANDFTVLTLDNSQVSFTIKQVCPNIYTVELKNGYYVCNASKSSWGSGSGTPLLYCELAQR